MSRFILATLFLVALVPVAQAETIPATCYTATKNDQIKSQVAVTRAAPSGGVVVFRDARFTVTLSLYNEAAVVSLSRSGDSVPGSESMIQAFASTELRPGDIQKRYMRLFYRTSEDFVSVWCNLNSTQ